MKRGRPFNESIKPLIIEILKERPMQTPESIKKRYKELKGFGTSWNTIKSNLDLLIKENLIKEEIMSENKRKIAVYSLI